MMRLFAAFLACAIPVSEVRSSQWCRCLATARLAFGRAVPWEALNSLYKDPDREAERTRAVNALVASVRPAQNIALVSQSPYQMRLRFTRRAS